MEDACIFEAVRLIDALNLYVPEHVNVDGEYLVLEDIPVGAILEYWEVSAGDWNSEETSEDEEDNEDSEDADESDESGSSDDGYYYSDW
jgi:hypothetical protein